MSEPLDRRLSVAPMMEWTDRHCRFFHRLIAPRALLYTEMVTTGALLHGDLERLLGNDAAEQPLALQLGGSEPDELASTAALAEAWGYQEVNLNCGCPSERVQRGSFGACLMREPALVAACVAAMRQATALPVTVKCRIGVDDSAEPGFLNEFVDAVAAAGCETFIVHARKAWLKGLSPKENRTIPPLRYEIVHALKAARPGLSVILNGGLREPLAAAAHLPRLDGVMIGREAYENPWSLRAFEQAVFGAGTGLRSRHAVLAAMLSYIEAQRSAGVPLRAITRHMLGLFNGLPGARAWRRHISTHANEPDAGADVVMAAARCVDQDLALAA